MRELTRTTWGQGTVETSETQGGHIHVADGAGWTISCLTLVLPLSYAAPSYRPWCSIFPRVHSWLEGQQGKGRYPRTLSQLTSLIGNERFWWSVHEQSILFTDLTVGSAIINNIGTCFIFGRKIYLPLLWVQKVLTHFREVWQRSHNSQLLFHLLNDQ